jgi:hypothetical protein
METMQLKNVSSCANKRGKFAAASENNAPQ